MYKNTYMFLCIASQPQKDSLASISRRTSTGKGLQIRCIGATWKAVMEKILGSAPTPIKNPRGYFLLKVGPTVSVVN
jgi:hypothetical protein